MVTVKVIDERTGKPKKDARVAISFDGLLRGGTDYMRTDEDGEAHFDVEPGQGKIYVDGSTKHTGYISGRVVVYA